MTQFPNDEDLNDRNLAVQEYLANFDCSLRLNKRFTQDKELYNWCLANLGAKYKDWFIWEGGGIRQDPFAVIYIKNPKRATLFRLMWNHVIIDSIDLQQ